MCRMSGLCYQFEIESCYKSVVTHENPTKKGFKQSGVVVDCTGKKDVDVYTYDYQTYTSSNIKKTANMLCENGFKIVDSIGFVNILANNKTGEKAYLSLKDGLVEFVSFQLQ